MSPIHSLLNKKEPRKKIAPSSNEEGASN